MNNNIDIKQSVSKVRKMSLFNLVSGFAFIILLIIYGAVAATAVTSIVNNPYYDPTVAVGTSVGGAIAVLIISLILGFANLILSILIIVECSKINSSGYVNKYSDLGSFLILSIIGLFISGTIVAIILFIMSGNVLRKIDQDVASGTYETNPQPNFNNNQTVSTNDSVKQTANNSKIRKLEEINELKEKGFIDDAEFKKMKDKIINSDE